VVREEVGSSVDGSDDRANKQRAVVAPSENPDSLFPFLPFLMYRKIQLPRLTLNTPLSHRSCNRDFQQ
jgi:hypothetical protein